MRGTHGLAYALLILFVLACECSHSKDQQPTSSPFGSDSGGTTPSRRTGEAVSVGFMRYQVHGSRYSDRFSDNQERNQPPDDSYLIIDLTVTNTANRNQMMPWFKLVDQNGTEYEMASRARAAERNLDRIRFLDPRVPTRGELIFDVPPDRTYRLKVTGGSGSTHETMIELTPSGQSGGGSGSDRRSR